nr:uncharacterized protein LOC110381997 [Helicoverpa armigera]
MKVFMSLLTLGLIALSYCTPEPEECYYDSRGLCMGECEPGTYSYTSNCDQMMIPEPTCDTPTPQEEEAPCDYSACYCKAPTVRDTSSGKCVPLEQCPKKQV